MTHRFAELQLLFLALVSLGALVSTQNPDGSRVELAALDVSLVDPGAAETSQFVRTASSFTDSDVVDKHNEIRADVLASNMEYVDQNESLSGDIKAWLSKCSYYDEMEVHWASSRFPHVNGFKAKSGIPFTTSEVIRIISQLPKSHRLYKMLMKSDMRYLGCGNRRCSTSGTGYTLVACLYAFRSKLNLTEEPYKSGEPCTECSSGTFWCHDNLCREDCYYSNARCECQIDCGKYSRIASNCSCLCPNGYDGSKCTDITSGSSCTEGGTTLIVSVTLIMLAVLSLSICILLYHKKYRRTRLSTEASVESRSSTATSSVCSTSSSSPSFDPSKYPTAPPAYSSLSPPAYSDPPPYGWTASPTD